MLRSKGMMLLKTDLVQEMSRARMSWTSKWVITVEHVSATVRKYGVRAAREDTDLAVLNE